MFRTDKNSRASWVELSQVGEVIIAPDPTQLNSSSVGSGLKGHPGQSVHFLSVLGQVIPAVLPVMVLKVNQSISAMCRKHTSAIEQVLFVCRWVVRSVVSYSLCWLYRQNLAVCQKWLQLGKEHFYTVGHKKHAPKLFSITLAIINRFR